jgi:hypothetical protein
MGHYKILGACLATLAMSGLGAASALGDAVECRAPESSPECWAELRSHVAAREGIIAVHWRHIANCEFQIAVDQNKKPPPTARIAELRVIIAKHQERIAYFENQIVNIKAEILQDELEPELEDD